MKSCLPILDINTYQNFSCLSNLYKNKGKFVQMYFYVAGTILRKGLQPLTASYTTGRCYFNLMTIFQRHMALIYILLSMVCLLHMVYIAVNQVRVEIFFKRRVLICAEWRLSNAFKEHLASYICWPRFYANINYTFKNN